MKKDFAESVENYTQKLLSFFHTVRMTPEQRHLKKLQTADYSHLPLSRSTEECIQKVTDQARKIYGTKWNYYSNALRREVVQVFETCIQLLSTSRKTVNYLEIGSCQGISMTLIAQLLTHVNALGKLVSVDPYFETGYVEGAHGIWEKDVEIAINKSTRDNAYKLYKLQKLNVLHIEEMSTVGLRGLICSDQCFDLIYIDGSHEGIMPLRDLGLSLELITPNGIIILDDHHWPDVKVIKNLCDRHFQKIAETWKVAAYAITPTRTDSNKPSSSIEKN